MRKTILKSLVYTLLTNALIIFLLLVGRDYINDSFHFNYKTERSVYYALTAVIIAFFSVLYFFIKGRTEHPWAYIIATAVFQAVCFMYTMAMGSFARNEWSFGLVAMMICVGVASLLLVDTVYTAGVSICKRRAKNSSNVVNKEILK